MIDNFVLPFLIFFMRIIMTNTMMTIKRITITADTKPPTTSIDQAVVSEES